MKTNIKMRVTPEQNKQVQKIIKGDILDITLSYPFLYLTEEDGLQHGSSEEIFENDETEEISPELFIRTNGTCEQQEPKYKIGDILKRKNEALKDFFIEIKEVSISVTGAIYYNVKDIENEKQYTYTERYLEQHFELKTDKNSPTNPNNYNQMKIQPNEYITANYDCLSWNTANVIKYVSRYKSKNGIEDLEKAIKYIQLEIKELKKDKQ